MPWYFPWSDSLKLKAYRYLLNRYFGFYFLDKLLLDQLDINLGQGKSSIRDVNLHSENLTSILSELSLPIEILNGFIKTVQFTIPWSSLLTDISVIEITDVDLYVCTKEKQTNSHQNSIFSMSDSIRLAEDYLKTEVPYQMGMEQTNFEGLEAFANTLDTILLRIKIIIKNINIYFVETSNGPQKVEFKLHINNLLFYDNKLNDTNLKDKTKDDNKLPRQEIYNTKKIINFDKYTLFSKIVEPHNMDHLDQPQGQDEKGDKFNPILISKGNTSLHITMNQLTQTVDPKIEIKLMLGGFYAILQPHALVRLVHLIYKVHQKSGDVSTKHNSLISHDNFIPDHGIDDDNNDLYYFPNNHASTFQTSPPEITGDNFSFYSLSPKSPSSSKHDHKTSEQSGISTTPKPIQSKQTYEHCFSYPSVYNDYSSKRVAPSFHPEKSSWCNDENRGPGDYSNDKGVGKAGHGFGVSQDKGSLCSSIEIRCEIMDFILIYDDCPSINTDIEKWLAFYDNHGNDLNVPDAALPRRDHLRVTIKGLGININTNQFPNHTTFWRALFHCKALVARETLCESGEPGQAAKVAKVLLKIEAPKHEKGVESGYKIEFTEIVSRGHHALDIHKSTPIDRSPFTKRLVDAWLGCLYLDFDLTLYERLDVLMHLFKNRFSPREDPLKKSTPSLQRLGFKRHPVIQTPFSYKPCNNSKFECKVVVEELTTKLRFPKLDPQLNFKDKVGHTNARKTKLHKEYLQLVIKHMYVTNLIKSSPPSLGDGDYGNVELSFIEASVKLCDDRSQVAITPIVFVDSGNHYSPTQHRPLPRIVIKTNRSLVSDCALQKSNLSTIYHSAREDELLLNLSRPGEEFIYSGLKGKPVGHYNDPQAATSNKLGDSQSQQHNDFHNYFGVGEEAPTDQHGHPSGPSPFTRKRIMYENKRIINPGTKEEMLEFVNHFQRHSQYFIDVSLPNVVVCIESKSLYELLYTRLLNDLLMWTPYAPLSSTSPTMAHNRWKFNEQSLIGNQIDEVSYEKFSDSTIDPLHRFMSLRVNIQKGQVVINTLLPKQRRNYPGSKGEMNSTKYSQFFVEFRNSYTLLTYTHEKHDNPHDIMVRLGHFQANFAHTNCEAEGKAYGEFNLPGLSEASSSTKLGLGQSICHAAQPCYTLIRSKLPCQTWDPGAKNQPSFTKDTIAPDANSFDPHKPFNVPKSFSYSPSSLGRGDETLEDLEFELRDKRPAPGTSKESHCSVDAKREELDDMLVLSSLSNFNRASGVKETTLSVCLNGALLDHKLAHQNEVWYSCIYEFFTLAEYAFSCAPLHRIDELHMSFNDCAIDYRPLYLPFKIYIDISSMCFSNLAFDMPRSSELKLLIEDSSVHLSNKIDSYTYADLKRDYVKVVSVGLFEVVIKRNYLNAKSHPDSPQNEDCFKGSSTEPQMEFKAINDALVISTCCDSCIALQNVLTYYALEGDLIEGPSAATTTMTGENNKENEPKASSKPSLPLPSHGCETTYDSNFPSGLASLKTSKGDKEELPAIFKLSLLMADAMDDDDDQQGPSNGKASSRVQSTAKIISPNETKIVANNNKVKFNKNGRNKASSSQQNTSVTSSNLDSCHSFTSTGLNSSYINRSSKILQSEPKLTTGVKTKKGVKSDPINASASPSVFRDSIDLNTREGKATFTNKSGTPPSNGSDDYAFIENTNKREHIIHKPETKLVCNLTPDQPVPPLVDNYFGVPEFSKYDQLKAPETFPTPLAKYLLNDITLVWELYGGHDFDEESHTRHNSGKSAMDVGNTPSPRTPRSSNQGTFFKAHKERRRRRNQDVLMQIHLNKIRFQHEAYPPDSAQVSRQVLTIQEIQILDKLTSSRLNKFLYPYTSEASPKKSNSPMLLIKALHYKPDVDIQSQEECILKVSLQPIRLNMDQEALMFLRDFFQKVTSSAEMEGVMDSSVTNSPNLSLSHRIATSGTSPVPSSPIMKVYQGDVSDAQYEALKSESKKEKILCSPHKLSEKSNRTLSTDTPDSSQSPIFFRPVIFSPEVPIKLDYHGKYFDAGQGTLIGLLMALAQLDCSEIRLKKLSIRSGILGIDKVINYALKEWITDIKNNQLQGILSGIGPMHSFVQLAQGIKDLVYLPIEQYKKDRRIIKGLKRGASSFTSLSAVSTLELSYKFVDFLKAAAETTYIMVSPDYEKICNKQDLSSKPTRPFDIREGVASAYHLVKEGFGETAYDLIKEATLEHRNKGLVGAMGSVIRNFPCTLVKPIVATAQATSTLLGGVKHQFVPEARKRALDKWKQPPMSY